MTNYKEMYRELFIATTKAIETLVEAQQNCEEMYMEAEERENVIRIIDKLSKDK